jgi:hypothetical protein
MKNTKLIFLHLPKTGGTTMRAILRRIYGKAFQTPHLGQSSMISAPHDIPATLIPQQLAALEPGCQVIGAHAFFGLHEFLGEDWRYITMIRHPVGRVLSSFYFKVQRGLLSPADLPRYVSGTLPEGRYKWVVNNFQTRYLSAERGVPLWVPFGDAPEGMLETAKQHLTQHFDLVGTTERFDETLLYLKQLYDWPLPRYTRFNRTTKRVQDKAHSPEIIETILAHNTLDMALYQFAQEHLDGCFAGRKDSFQQELRYLHMQNAWFTFSTGIHKRLMSKWGHLLPF